MGAKKTNTLWFGVVFSALGITLLIIDTGGSFISERALFALTARAFFISGIILTLVGYGDMKKNKFSSDYLRGVVLMILAGVPLATFLALVFVGTVMLTQTGWTFILMSLISTVFTHKRVLALL